tara:strand:+ start:1281 stop:1973 length:693 start_codon:yes stop_codon:yes gene_type:complete
MFKGIDVHFNQFSTRIRPYISSNDKGFSLIELIIVLLIIGFLSGMVLINIGNNFKRELRSEAERLQKIIIAGSDEAVFSSSEIGVIFQGNGYQLLRFNPALNAWEPFSDGLFEPYNLPGTMSLQWTVEGYRQYANTDLFSVGDVFEKSQSDMKSHNQASANEQSDLLDRFTGGLALMPELVLSSSGELPTFEVLFTAAEGVENPARIQVSSDGFSLPSIIDLSHTFVVEE